jgi:FAD/FMN-containing dehydrogenase
MLRLHSNKCKLTTYYSLGDLYAFAESNNITIVGGSARTVGAAGGWLAGGGHGALSNTLGLGVDNALEIKAVLPNGTYVTANRCQNTDLFFALRGGGGNTFGINYEVTTTAHPQLTLQVANFIIESNSTAGLSTFIDLVVQNGDTWAQQGWGGYITPGAATQLVNSLIMFNPVLNNSAATASMQALLDFASASGNLALYAEVMTASSFTEAYNTYIYPHEELVGFGAAVGSRMLPRSLFETTAGQESVSSVLKEIAEELVPETTTSDPILLTYNAPLQILATTPYNYPGDNTSSVTPAWRTATWHVISGAASANNATVSEINSAFATAHNITETLTAIAPNSGAYQNEADVFQTNPEEAFWGSANYAQLAAIKKEVDPGNLLTCWDCIGWDSGDEGRWGCYPNLI